MGLLLPTTVDLLRLQAQRRGSTPALCHRRRRMPFGQIATAVIELAAWLARRGIGAGDRVGVLAANDPAAVVAAYAVWSLGGVVVPISTRAAPPEACRLLAHAHAAGVVCDAARIDLARAAAADAGIAVYVCEPELPLRPRVARRARVTGRRKAPRPPRPDDLAVLAYTSGTTGAPKGVMITHGNLLWSALACAGARGDTAESVGACLSPLSHTPVFVSHLLCRFLAGGTAVLFEKFDARSLLEDVERFGITDLPFIAGMVFDVAALSEIPDAVRRSVRKVSVGGAATPMEAKHALARLFADSEVIEAYGQSESTNGVTMARGGSVFEHAGTVGRVNPYVNVAIRRPDGSPADDGEEGEIVVAGPTVMRGYYRARAASAAAIRDGWLHTGDVGRRDRDGYFYVTGRVKELIITGGENVSPAEVEEVLRMHPAVEDVAVVGTPHPKWGEQVTAVVVRRPGIALEQETLAAFAATRLAAFKKPRRIEFVAALPRNAANKVQTSLLKEQLSKEETKWRIEDHSRASG